MTVGQFRQQVDRQRAPPARRRRQGHRTGGYAADTNMPGMLWASAAGPHAHARIKVGFDTSKPRRWLGQGGMTAKDIVIYRRQGR